jgi:hypothetical protein
VLLINARVLFCTRSFFVLCFNPLENPTHYALQFRLMSFRAFLQEQWSFSFTTAVDLLLGGGLGEVGKSLAALELGVLDHTWWKTVLVWVAFPIEEFRDLDLPASASLEKLPVYSTKVEPSRSPLVTA